MRVEKITETFKRAQGSVKGIFDRKDLIGAGVSLIVTILGTSLLNATLKDSEYYSALLSSILAIIGVSITGYIFLIEYLRRLKTDRPIYKDAATDYQKRIFLALKVTFWSGVILGALCALFLGGITIPENGPEWILQKLADLDKFSRPTILFLFLFLLFKTIRTDVWMMNPEKKIYERIESIREEALKEINDADLIIRLNSDEYREMISSPEFIRGIPEETQVPEEDEKGRRWWCIWHKKPCKVYDPPNTITFIRGSDTENVRVKYGERIVKNTGVILGYRDNSDEYDVRNVLNIFSDVETLLCRIIGVEDETVPENISISGILSGSSMQFKEIGMANDIDWYYNKLRRYRDYYMLSYNDVFQLIEDNKHGKKRKPKVRGKITETDFDKGAECAISGPWFIFDDVKEDTDLPDEISFKGWVGQLRIITPMVLMLRYEISKKLSMKNISDMVLPNYDFSYANMRNTSMRNSYLANATFFHANLSSANFSGSNLREVDFRRSTCDGTNLSSCDIHNASFAKSNLVGSVIAGANVSSCLFPGISMNNCDAHNAAIIYCRMIGCNLSGSSFYETSMNSSVIDDCAMHNSNLGLAKIVDCSLSGNAFNGSLFMGSVINRSSIVKSTFINTKMTGSEMSALMILQSDFSNSEMQRINFTETQIMAAEFKSSRLDYSLFNKSSIGPFSLPPDEKKKIRGEDAEKLESNVVIFDHSSMRECHFTESDISCALIRFVIMEGAEFNSTSVSHSSFKGSDMKGTVIIDSRVDECDLSNASLEGASLTNTTISNCKMTNCNMKGASLSGVSLRNTDISDTNMSNAKIVGCKFIGVKGMDSQLLLGAEVLYDITFINCRDVNGKLIPTMENVKDVRDFLEQI